MRVYVLWINHVNIAKNFIGSEKMKNILKSKSKKYISSKHIKNSYMKMDFIITTAIIVVLVATINNMNNVEKMNGEINSINGKINDYQEECILIIEEW